MGINCCRESSMCCFGPCFQSSTASSSSSNEIDPTCPFCEYATDTNHPKVLFKDDKCVIFSDRSPAADVHLLVCPLEHIPHFYALKSDKHYDLLLHMETAASRYIQELKQSDANSSIQMGFHLPPFYSVKHLHLHVLAGEWIGNKTKYNEDECCAACWYLPLNIAMQRISLP